MGKNEFLDSLRRALTAGVGAAEAMEHIRYYEEYFASEEAKGRSEEEILEMLGDPRLLARTIVEAEDREGASQGRQETFVPDEDETAGTRVHEYRLPGWLMGLGILLLVLLVVLLVVGIVTSILSLLLPVIIPVALVLLIIRVFQKNNG